MVEATKAGHLTPLEHSIDAAVAAHDSATLEAFRTSSEYLAAEAKVAALRNFRSCQASLKSFMDMDSDNIDEIQSAVSAVRSAAESAGVPPETALVRNAGKRLDRLSRSKAACDALLEATRTSDVSSIRAKMSAVAEELVTPTAATALKSGWPHWSCLVPSLAAT
jgi:hypothetical protein